MRIFFFISLISSLTLFTSCGRGNLKIKLKEESLPENKQINKFRMSTQEELVNKYPVIEEVDLYELVPNLDSLPIHYDSFMEIYRALEIKGATIQSTFVILKKDPNCLSEVGYCRAVFIKR